MIDAKGKVNKDKIHTHTDIAVLHTKEGGGIGLYLNQNNVLIYRKLKMRRCSLRVRVGKIEMVIPKLSPVYSEDMSINLNSC